MDNELRVESIITSDEFEKLSLGPETKDNELREKVFQKYFPSLLKIVTASNAGNIDTISGTLVALMTIERHLRNKEPKEKAEHATS